MSCEFLLEVGLIATTSGPQLWIWRSNWAKCVFFLAGVNRAINSGGQLESMLLEEEAKGTKFHLSLQPPPVAELKAESLVKLDMIEGLAVCGGWAAS